MKILKWFFVYVHVKFIICVDLLAQNQQDDQSISNFICKVTTDIIKTSAHTQDVLIGKFYNQSRTSVVNDIAECLNDVSSIVITDFKHPIMEKNLRKATVIIVELDSADVVKTIKII